MGAELSLVTEHMASALKAKRYREDMNIASVNVESLSKHYIEIELDLLHPTSSPVRVSVKAHVVPNLRSVRPPGDIQRVLHLPHIKGKQPLADPELGGEVDILLGMLNVIKCLRGPIEIPPDQETIATVFGWTLGGAKPESSMSASVMRGQPAEDHNSQLLQRL